MASAYIFFSFYSVFNQEPMTNVLHFSPSFFFNSHCSLLIWRKVIKPKPFYTEKIKFMKNMEAF